MFQVLLVLILSISTINADSDHHHGSGHEHHDHGSNGKDHHHHSQTSSHEGHHVHTAPNGGMLVEIGEHSGNIELKLDAKKGELKLWLLDGCAENYVRSKSSEIVVQVITRHLGLEIEEAMLDLKLKPKANLLTGETVGDTSLFQIKDKRLIGAKRLKGMIPSLTYKSVEFKQLYFDLKI